jgi:hypothetical protein
MDMNLLATVLPGIRHVRAPITAGIAWLSVIFIWGMPTWPTVLRDNPGLGRTRDTLGSYWPTISVSVLAFSSYLLGNAIVAVTALLLRRLDSLTLHLLNFLKIDPYEIHGRIEPWPRRIVVNIWGWWTHISVDAANLYRNAIESMLGELGVPESVYHLFHGEPFLNKSTILELELWKGAPEQYQEYDRLQAEAEFRYSISPPLVALGAVLPVGFTAFTFATAALIGLILVGQARRQQREATELLAGAIFMGYVAIPALKVLQEEIRRLSVPPTSEKAWIATTLGILWRRGLGLDGMNVIALLVKKPRDEVQEIADDMKEHGSARGAQILMSVKTIVDANLRSRQVRQHLEHGDPK